MKHPKGVSPTEQQQDIFRNMFTALQQHLYDATQNFRLEKQHAKTLSKEAKGLTQLMNQLSKNLANAKKKAEYARKQQETRKAAGGGRSVKELNEDASAAEKQAKSHKKEADNLNNALKTLKKAVT